MPSNFSYPTKEKLKSRKLLDQLFTKGKSVSAFPLKAFYMVIPDASSEIIQTGVGVSSRNFTKAVDRNRIKRLLREAYRLNKQLLHVGLEKNQKKLAVFILFVGKEKPAFELLHELMPTVIQKILVAIDKP